jgi:hypothetical protein
MFQPQEDADCQVYFNHLASMILGSGSTLMINRQPHQIIEIEFYLTSDFHPDPFTHKHPLQATRCQWYFHRSGPNGNYRGGTYKGLDITLGQTSDTSSTYAGLLIRSLASNGNVINGPCCCVDYILRISGVESISSLIEINPDLSIWNNSMLFLRFNSTYSSFYSTPRVGLSLKSKSVIERDYISRRYRFIWQCDLVNRIKKGVELLIIELHLSRYSISQISRITGCGITKINKVIDERNQSDPH